MKKALPFAVIIASAVLAQAVRLTPEEFVVKAGVARYWKFNVTGNTGRVVGAFRASGGAHNDIRVLVTDGDECENYLNGNRANAYYDSGAKTVGRFDLKLSRAGYRLIFDNRNSIVSPKEIAAQVALAKK
jgi:hypothetical protein